MQRQLPLNHPTTLIASLALIAGLTLAGPTLAAGDAAAGGRAWTEAQ